MSQEANRSILFVDDMPIRHQMLRKQTEPEVRIDSAYTAAEAISMLEKFPYSIVSLDHDLGTFQTGMDIVAFIC